MTTETTPAAPPPPLDQLESIRHMPIDKIPAGQRANIVRRVMGAETGTPALQVAAFQSAI